VDIDNNKVKSAMYTDMRVSYTFKEDGGWQAFFNVSNLFDKAPPVTAYFSTFTASPTQTNSTGLFDQVGRRFTAGVKFRY